MSIVSGAGVFFQFNHDCQVFSMFCFAFFVRLDRGLLINTDPETFVAKIDVQLGCKMSDGHLPCVL